MKHRLTYSAEFIDKILDGSKTITLRNPEKYKDIKVGDELEFVTEGTETIFATKVVKEVKQVCLVLIKGEQGDSYFQNEFEVKVLDQDFNELQNIFEKDGFGKDGYDFYNFFIKKVDNRILRYSQLLFSHTLKRTLIAF